MSTKSIDEVFGKVTVQSFIVKRENLKKFFTVIIHQKSRHFCNLADYLLLVEYFEIKNL